jgi:3',5'-cyclic AMP phosphodiesterase CpdA
MKLVHISDIHIDPNPILGIDPVANFRACLGHVAAHHADADRIVITGDLTHHGAAESYEMLRSILDDSPLEGARAPRLLIGNHDRRDAFRKVFPEAVTDGNGHVQWAEEVGDALFVYLDTAEEGTHAGHYGPDRRSWLSSVLDGARRSARPVYLFMHHNPTAVHVANADVIGLVHEEEFQALVASYAEIVRHIFFGHCHFTLSGTMRGIPFSAPRSTCHTCWPDFSGIANRMGYGDLVPNYNVCMLGDSSSVIHSIDFLDADKVRWRLD